MVLAIGAWPIGENALDRVQQPLDVHGQRVPAMRFADSRIQALLNAVLDFRLLPRGFSNGDLRKRLALLLGRRVGSITPGQMTYDLRRLRLHGVIRRVPKSHRYLTDFGASRGPLLHPSLRVVGRTRTALVYDRRRRSRSHLRRGVPPRDVRAIAALVDEVRLVSEEEMPRAIVHLLLEEHVVAEPAGAAATAAFLRQPSSTAGPVVILVSGANISPEVLRAAASAAP